MKRSTLFFVLLFGVFLYAQKLSNIDRAEILLTLENQKISWNEGNLEKYMEGYWKSDSLRFIGKSGIRYGWNATFEGYKKGYPNKDAMGTLKFEVLSLEALSKNKAFMIGKWDLARRKENAGGYFTLIWRKIKEKWLVTTDHSS